ncbi:MFS general substrate transporter [Trametes maxima]|nr:MFS general substrate transporter [Trametes maxima]
MNRTGFKNEPEAPSKELKNSKDVETLELAVDGGTRDVYGNDPSVDPVYQAKSQILNNAFQEIGMGKYQANITHHDDWYLFCVTGFGWYSDNLWPIVISLILDPVITEFGTQAPYIKVAQGIGLLVGAAFWGVAADVWGRKWCYNLTLLITAIFATAAGASPTYTALCSLIAAWNVGVGGNLPVDSAVFLEFIPASHQYLLTILSIWWAIGQLVGSLIGWPFLVKFSCVSADDCPRSSNQGWRYFLYTNGAIMMVLFAVRFFVFDMYESPKFLMGRGRDAEAVAVVHDVARYNGRESKLTLAMLQEVDRRFSGGLPDGGRALDTSARAAVMRSLRTLGREHMKGLFGTRKLAYSTTLLIIVWCLIGLAFPLYYGFVTLFLASRGADFGDGSPYITYRNQVILSVIGVPGALLAGWMVELPYVGRKGTLAMSTIITGVFLFASTTARTSNALLGWNCGFTFTSNVMYGVLYAVTPELFPAKDRGTGNALVGSANRVFGIIAPIIALYTNLATSVPIWIAGALFIVAGMVSFLLPFEPRGKASI